MKPFSTRVMALTGAFLAVSSVSEAALNYSDGDLLLAFRASGGAGAATDYIVNLGSASTYVNAVTTLVLDTEIGNIKADLDAIFGANWQTRVDFLWSVSGVQKISNGEYTANTMFASRTQNSPLTLGQKSSTAWARPSISGATIPAGKIQGMGTTFALGDGDGTSTGSTESTNSAFALIQPTSAINSYRSYMPDGINTNLSTAFSYFGGATGIEGNFGGGTSGVVLDFYTVATASGSPPATFEGTFSIDNNAVVTFTPVPEPSSMMALGLGVAVLGAFRRRRAAH
jgi:hypothetical protein